MSTPPAVRTALVTGASRGLGAAMAIRLAADGLQVAVNYLHNQASAERVCDQIRSSGGRAEAFAADVRDESQVAALVRTVAASLGPIDTLVVNATGPQPFLSIEQQTWAAHLDQLEFFVKSPLLLLQQVLPGMRRAGFGRVIQIGSEVVELGNPRFAAYVAAKSAQLGLTRSWARELARDGITVNLVAPGWIPTERHADATDADLAAYTVGVPMQRRGSPEDVAAAVSYLASGEAGFVTGQKISVNGANTLA